MIAAILLVCLLAISAFLSASETALFSLSPFTLRRFARGGKGALSLTARLMEHPKDVLVTILMFNVLANILVQNTVSSLFDSFPDWSLKVGLPLLLTLVFGEVIPKSMAIGQNTSLAPKVAPFIAKLVMITLPLQKRLTFLTSAISRFLFFFFRDEKEISEEELYHVLKVSEEKGVITPEEGRFAGGILELQALTLHEVMRPRDEILFFSLDEPLMKLTHLFVEQECSRILLVEGAIDAPLGILDAETYFFHQEEISEGKDLLALVKKPFFAPESMEAWNLLKSLRSKQEQVALVVDEYGSVTGLVAEEDLVEIVVGEIADLRDASPLYTRSGPDVIIASGKLEISEFNKIFSSHITSQDQVTIAGYLLQELGDIPPAGTQYATDEFLFYVLSADPNRVKRLYIRKLKGRR